MVLPSLSLLLHTSGMANVPTNFIAIAIAVWLKVVCLRLNACSSCWLNETALRSGIIYSTCIGETLRSQRRTPRISDPGIGR